MDSNGPRPSSPRRGRRHAGRVRRTRPAAHSPRSPARALGGPRVRGDVGRDVTFGCAQKRVLRRQGSVRRTSSVAWASARCRGRGRAASSTKRAAAGVQNNSALRHRGRSPGHRGVFSVSAVSGRSRTRIPLRRTPPADPPRRNGKAMPSSDFERPRPARHVEFQETPAPPRRRAPSSPSPRMPTFLSRASGGTCFTHFPVLRGEVRVDAEMVAQHMPPSPIRHAFGEARVDHSARAARSGFVADDVLDPRPEVQHRLQLRVGTEVPGPLNSAHRRVNPPSRADNPCRVRTSSPASAKAARKVVFVLLPAVGAGRRREPGSCAPRPVDMRRLHQTEGDETAQHRRTSEGHSWQRTPTDGRKPHHHRMLTAKNRRRRAAAIPMVSSAPKPGRGCPSPRRCRKKMMRP